MEASKEPRKNDLENGTLWADLDIQPSVNKIWKGNLTSTVNFQIKICHDTSPIAFFTSLSRNLSMHAAITSTTLVTEEEARNDADSFHQRYVTYDFFDFDGNGIDETRQISGNRIPINRRENHDYRYMLRVEIHQDIFRTDFSGNSEHSLSDNLELMVKIFDDGGYELASRCSVPIM